MQQSPQLPHLTQLLQAWSDEPECVNQVLSETYGELHKLAKNALSKRAGPTTLPPTALVHEACLKLIPKRNFRFGNRLQYFALVGLMMRHILADNAKMKGRNKRKMTLTQFDLEKESRLGRSSEIPMESLNDALDALSKLDPRKAQVVELKFFAGLSFTEIGEVLDLSETTAKRDWRMAKAWLFGQLQKTKESPSGPCDADTNQTQN